MDCDHSVVLLSAIRYMVGRSSYGVGCVIDYAKKHANELTKSNKEVIERDIREYFDKWPEHRTKEDWYKLIDYINSK